MPAIRKVHAKSPKSTIFTACLRSSSKMLLQ